MKSIHKRLALKVAMLSMSSLAAVTPAFADNALTKIGNSITSGMTAIISAVLLCIGAYFLFTRDWMKMLSFVAIAILVNLFSNWDTVHNIAQKIYTSFIG